MTSKESNLTEEEVRSLNLEGMKLPDLDFGDVERMASSMASMILSATCTGGFCTVYDGTKCNGFCAKSYS